jgi:hypothetical protein
LVGLGLERLPRSLVGPIKASVVIPYSSGCPHRAKALDFVLAHYRALGLDTEVAEIEGPWIKAHAVMPAVKRAAGTVIVSDADVIADGLAAGVRALDSGYAWAAPHRRVHRLTRAATKKYVAGHSLEGLELEQRPYHGMLGGGILIARKETFLDVPLDPRFVGWGQEDESWAIALHTLAGKPFRGVSDLVHLWHPPQERVTRRRGNQSGWRLMKRYRAARRDPKAMRALLEEIDAN